MKTSDNGIAFIKKWEGLSLKAVQLAGEPYWTWGYGHYGEDVPPGGSITLQAAEELLKRDLVQFETYVSSYCARYAKFTPNQNQFDALVSFTYNCGPDNLKRLVQNRTAEQAAAHIEAYTGSFNEAFRDGLTRRRREEKALFLTPVPAEKKEEEETMVRYERLKDIPASFRSTIETLMNAGIIQGDGSDKTGNNDVIDLSHDQVRNLVFSYRGGAFDKALLKAGLPPAIL